MRKGDAVGRIDDAIHAGMAAGIPTVKLAARHGARRLYVDRNALALKARRHPEGESDEDKELPTNGRWALVILHGRAPEFGMRRIDEMLWARFLPSASTQIQER